MQVIFRRTGERRYAVVLEIAGEAAQTMSPAPGFDPHIPHDLVHYVVEAELGMQGGVFGRAARGGGTFYNAQTTQSPRQQARNRRKQARREQALRREPANEEQLAASERLAYLADIAWRRRHGQRPDPAFAHSAANVSAFDAARVQRVVERLDVLAAHWNQLAPGDELAFTWPSSVPMRPEQPGAHRSGTAVVRSANTKPSRSTTSPVAIGTGFVNMGPSYAKL